MEGVGGSPDLVCPSCGGTAADGGGRCLDLECGEAMRTAVSRNPAGDDHVEAGERALVCPSCGGSEEDGGGRCVECDEVLKTTPARPAASAPPAVLPPQPTPAPTACLATLRAPWAANITVSEGASVLLGSGAGTRFPGEIQARDPDRWISRVHLELSISNGRLVVKDHGSTNGTWVNDAQIDPGVERVLQSGNVIVLAPCPEVDEWDGIALTVVEAP